MSLILSGGRIATSGGGLWNSPGSAQTFDFYISTTGSDANPGTLSQPWAITTLSRWTSNGHNTTNYGKLSGMRLGLLPGTYSVGSLINLVDSGAGQGYNPGLTIPAGTSSAQTYVGSSNSSGFYERGQAIIDAQSATNNASTMGQADDIYPNEGYVTVDGLVFKNPPVGAHNLIFGGSSDYGHPPHINGVVVKNCEFTSQDFTNMKVGNNGQCVDFQGVLGGLVQNCYFHNFTGPNWGGSGGPTDTSIHMMAVQLWYSQGCILEYNTVVGGLGFMGKEFQNFGNTIRYNYIDTSGWKNAYCLWDFSNEPSDPAPSAGFSNSIYNNVLVGVSDLLSSDTYTWYNPGSVNFYNNTSYVVPDTSILILGFRAKTPAGDFSSYNNIFQLTTSGSYQITNASAPNVVDYNAYYSSAGNQWGYYSSNTSTPPAGFPTTLSAWQTDLGSAVDAHSVVGTNPLLLSPGTTGSGASSYKLQVGSPCIGAGRVGGTSGGTSVDMGAWGGTDVNTGLPIAQIGSTLGPS